MLSARFGRQFVVEAEHGRVAVEERTLDLGHHHADVLLLEVAAQAQRAERAAGVVGFLGQQRAVLGARRRCR